MSRDAGDSTSTTTTEPNLELRERLGDPLLDFAQTSLTGQNIGQNPFLDDLVNRSSRSIINQVQSNFGRSGRNARGIDAAGIAADRMVDLNAAIRGPAMQSDLNRQQNTFANILSALGSKTTQQVPMETNVGANVLGGATLGQLLFPNSRFGGLIGGGIGTLF